MRWIIPITADLPTALLAAWNAPVVTMLGEKSRNFCWGGGTAIRRSLFEQSGVLELWKSAVSDDYSLTRALERGARSIVFIPECLTPSYAETDFAGLLEFTNRQVQITKVYAPHLWRTAAQTHVRYCLTILLGIALIVTDLIAQRPWFHIAMLTFLPVLLSSIRGALRLMGVSEALSGARAQITGQAWIYLLLTVFVPFLYLANFLNSLGTQRIRWRGVTYELVSADQTRVL